MWNLVTNFIEQHILEFFVRNILGDIISVADCISTNMGPQYKVQFYEKLTLVFYI